MSERLFWCIMIVLLTGALTAYSCLCKASDKSERPYVIGCP